MPQREDQWWRGGTLGPADGPNLPAYSTQEGTSFGEQIAGLQSLGQSVTAAAAAKVPQAGDGGGVSFVDEEQPEDPSVAAANFARNEHPKAAAKTDLGSALDTFFSLLGGIGG